MLQKYLNFLEERKNSKKYRELSITETSNLLDFSTNDYLCLGSKNNNNAIKYGTQIAKKYGIGSTGSRLLSGNNQLFLDFEKQIAIDKNTEKALIFNSGYQANSSTLSALCDSQILGQQAQVFFDKSNHSSLYQGIFLAKAELLRYNHNNLEDLERLLEKNKNSEKPKFIVTESVFGMDGDTPDLKKLTELAIKYDAILYIDEAHATGVFGEKGYGLVSQYAKLHDKIVIMGTFSKAIGVCGAYIASNSTVIDFLINKCPGFIYSTAFSPMILGAAFYNWNEVKSKKIEKARELLLKKADFLNRKLKQAKFDTLNSNTHIILIKVKNEQLSFNIKQILHNKNIVVSAIRPPTTPDSRIRIALNIKHTWNDIRYLINTLLKIKEYF